MSKPPDETDAGALTELQMAVIGALWETPGATLAEVTAALKPTRDLAATTVATLLSRLEQRGAVRREGVTRVYRYFANVTRGDARRDAIRRMRDSLFGGDGKAVLAHLIHEEPLSADDAAYLRALIDGIPAMKGAADSRTETSKKRNAK